MTTIFCAICCNRSLINEHRADCLSDFKWQLKIIFHTYYVHSYSNNLHTHRLCVTAYIVQLCQTAEKQYCNSEPILNNRHPIIEVKQIHGAQDKLTGTNCCWRWFWKVEGSSLNFPGICIFLFGLPLNDHKNTGQFLACTSAPGSID